MKETEKKEELQSRRDFFKNAAKKALPILGAIVLSSVPLQATSAPHPTDCNSTCQIMCGVNCQLGCKGKCADNCAKSCSTRSCENGCKGGCQGVSVTV